MKLLIFISFIVIFIFLVWEIIVLRNIRKKLDKSNTEINDSIYFDLNAKFKSIVAIGTFVFFIVGFLGWNSIDNINEDIKDKLSDVDSLSLSIESINTEVENIVSFIEIFNNVARGNLEKIISETEQEAKNLSDELQTISNAIKTKQSKFYIVKNLKINRNEYNPIKKKTKKFYYNTLKTFKGESLPKFNEKPILLIFSNYGLDTILNDNNSEFFELSVLGSYDCEECLFDLIIFY